MYADDVEGVIVTELELETASQAGQNTRDGTHHDGPQRGNHIGGRGDGDQAGDHTRSGTHCGVVAGANLLGEAPRKHCGGGSGGSGNPSITSGTVGGEGGTSVEAEPAEPQQEGAEHHERHVVRAERLSAEALTLADDEHDNQGGDCGVDVHHGTTCEIVGGRADGFGDGAVSRQQTTVPDHVGHRSVVEGNPQRHENHPGAVLHTLGDGATDQAYGNHREGDLEGDVHRNRVVVAVQTGGGEHAVLRDHGVLQQEAAGRVAEDASDVGTGVCDGPTPQSPNNHSDRQRGRLKHQHVQYGLGANHTTVEERHTRRHEENQGRGCQNPCGVTGINRSHVYLPLFRSWHRGLCAAGVLFVSTIPSPLWGLTVCQLKPVSFWFRYAKLRDC